MSQVRLSSISFGDRVLDRLKLQFLAHGNWRAELTASGLPEEVQTVVRQVVSKTGLLRFEKAEITRELINHFLDGRDRDRSWESLVEDFGKIDVAVSLFRSSKLRSRPMSIKAFRGSFYALSVGLLGYLSLQLFFHSAVPEPSVDYGAMLNETVTSAPVEQQAWPHYRELYIKYGLAEGETESFKEIYVEDGDSTSSKRLVRPSDEQWSDAVAKLESVEELLSAWRTYSKLPHLGTPLHLDRRKYSDADLKALFPHFKREDLEESGINEWGLKDSIGEDANELISGSIFGILLPHIQQFREAARLLHVDTRLAVTQGDQDRAVANINAIHGLARQAADAPVLVCILVGYSVNGIGFGVTEEIIIENPDFFDEDHLRELQQHAAKLQFSELLQPLSFEQHAVKDMIQRIYSDDGNGDGRITAVGAEVQFAATVVLEGLNSSGKHRWHYVPIVRSIIAPISMFSAPSRKEMENMFEDSFKEWSERLKRPMWETENTDWDEYLDQQDDSGLLECFFGGITPVKNVREGKLAYRDAVLLALACHRYRKANQEWPTTLDQLVGKWLKDTPIDRINGKPLNFLVKDDKLVIYSLGHDGDDDGGVSTDSETPWLDKTGDGDWIVWPQADM